MTAPPPDVCRSCGQILRTLASRPANMDNLAEPYWAGPCSCVDILVTTPGCPRCDVRPDLCQDCA